MKILYIDTPSGICGDMLLSAFIDLGIKTADINRELAKLKLPEKPKVVAKKGMKNALAGIHARVLFSSARAPHHRSLREIRSIITKSSLKKEVKDKSLELFLAIAEVEAKIHKVPIEKIHFHEIGAVDSIADIISICFCFSVLKPDAVFFSKIPVGTGTVKTDHGYLPLPAPAASKLLKGAPIYGVDVKGELVTPTGAAVVKCFADGFTHFPPMNLQKIGTGMGTRNFPKLPGTLRIFIGDSDESLFGDTVNVIETNIDNITPEHLAYVQELLMEKGALDVTVTPTVMKKGRSGFILSVICADAAMDKMMRLIFTETPTIGVRYHKSARRKLPRESIEVKTPYGKIRAKRVTGPSGIRIVPEYDELRKIAGKTEKSIVELAKELRKSLNQ